MSQFVDGPVRTFTSGAALAPHLRVKYSAGKVVLSGASDEDVGIVEKRVHAADEPVAIRLRNAQGTRKMVAAGSIAAGANVYAAANGKVDDTGTKIVGTALEAAAADGDVLEVLPLAIAVTVVEVEST